MIVRTVFLGINNAEDPLSGAGIQYGQDEVVLSGNLTKSVNFHITKDGIATVRNGRTKILTGTAAHSFFVDKSGTRAYFVDGSSLKSLNSDYTASTLYAVTAGRRMNYAEHYGPARDYMLFMGNGVQMLKDKDGTVSAWQNTSSRDTDLYLPQETFNGLPLTSIIHSFYDRMYAADGRFLLWSESTDPYRWRRQNNYPVEGEITAISSDRGALYVHTRSHTACLIGRGPDSFAETIVPIGAIKHGAINARGMGYVMSPQGWAVAHDGIIEYADEGNFILDLDDTAEAYMAYNPITREVLCSANQ